ncbi:MAG: response regulator transcription factor [Chloroflexi bacterium]|nr:response regulator transcription factor [Chloroflexota bacterium]OJV95199.1 MAG: DNA-binding response regulator [Chloroflexi bacterium 54-19]
MSKILVVDDDPRILSMLKRGLLLEGYEVETAATGQEALRLARQAQPDLVVLDVMLPEPGPDGLEISRSLRQNGPLPILMLTAKDTVPDRVAGLEAGADDYLVKPFAFDELVARVKALLRRSVLNENYQSAPTNTTELSFADLVLKLKEYRAVRGNYSIDLTAREFKLLEFFLRHPRQVLSREMILENVWTIDYEGESNVVDVHVRALRDKLEARNKSRLIQTVRGAGYALREE